MKYKLVAFDMDGTLITWNSCWGAIHRYFGVEEMAMRNFEAYKRGEIDYAEFMRRDIWLWKPRPHISLIDKILSRFELAHNVQEVVEEIRKKGYFISIITAGIDLLARRVGEKLGIAHVVANGLAVDDRGYLTGEGILRVDPSLKHEILEKIARELNLTLAECVAVGDSKYDTSFLKNAGLGVAVGCDEELAKVADVVIRDFKNLPQLLRYL